MPGVRSHPMALAGLSAVAAATTLVSLLTWQGFTQNFGSTLGPLFVVAVVVAGTGAVGRWWRLPRPLLVLAQVLLVGMVVCAFVCGSPLPIGEAWDRLLTAFQDAAQSANRFAPPVPSAEPPVHPLLIAGGCRVPAARRHPRLHPAPRPPGRAAAADDLQRAGEHDRRRARTGSSTRSPRSGSSR